MDLHKGKVPHWSAETNEEVDEARGLLYVGVTRAATRGFTPAIQDLTLVEHDVVQEPVLLDVPGKGLNFLKSSGGRGGRRGGRRMVSWARPTGEIVAEGMSDSHVDGTAKSGRDR